MYSQSSGDLAQVPEEVAARSSRAELTRKHSDNGTARFVSYTRSIKIVYYIYRVCFVKYVKNIQNCLIYLRTDKKNISVFLDFSFLGVYRTQDKSQKQMILNTWYSVKIVIVWKLSNLF